jgi:non-structural maintenance of chromosomes element 4
VFSRVFLILTLLELKKLLENLGNINLFRFIVNPKDFGQSVENMFYLSFLIRDGRCALTIETGEPIICQYPLLLLASVL